MTETRIVAIEWAMLEGRRPRSAGCNARLGEHGAVTRVPIVRLTDSDGAQGIGAAWIGTEQANKLLGTGLREMSSAQHGVSDEWLAFDYPLWDLYCKRTGQPAYALAAQITGHTPPASLRVPCYDTSLYIDDLRITSDELAAQLIAEEARQGMARGHTAFKLKIGRGARHMPVMAGTARDIAVIHAVRQVIGAQALLMVDANNGYNLNLAKYVLQQTRDDALYWLEEPFHEDAELYRDLKNWLKTNHIPVLIADGEGDASPHLLDWAHEGLIDIIQYDVIGHGFTRWLRTAQQLDAWGVQSAPHHYGTGYGNYVSCHLAAAATHFARAEWDASDISGLSAPGYQIEAGYVTVPAVPGFGVDVQEEAFQHAVKQSGGTVRL
jgi:L-alanine-DL-glutamate epimerase-like enolase superfamily enzyme